MKANVFYIFVALLLIVMNTTAQNKTIYDFKWQQSTPLPSNCLLLAIRTLDFVRQVLTNNRIFIYAS